MLGYLKGHVLDLNEGKLIVTIGAPGAVGVGYLVAIPQSASYGSLKEGMLVELFLHTHVREDALDLYGFATQAEKELFLTLLTVTGIGPKGAMGILSRVEPAQLIQSILTGDKDSLVQIPGIGKKTAERVVLELSDPIKKKMDAGIFGGVKPAVGVAGGRGPVGASADFSFQGNALLRDARDALLGLGYREQEVTPFLKKACEGASAPERVEDLVKLALQQLR